MKRDHILLAEEFFQITRGSCDASRITLRAEHLPTGLVIERAVAFSEESHQRRLLAAELAAALERRYPARDFVVEHLWMGPEKGASLVVRHVPSGLFAGRNVGYEPQSQHLRELFAELLRALQAKASPAP